MKRDTLGFVTDKRGGGEKEEDLGCSRWACTKPAKEHLGEGPCMNRGAVRVQFQFHGKLQAALARG